MRLIRLALERYGAFTDRTVEFRPDARLHVVLGANEAGKSTALAAVTDLLFGFGKSTPYAFLHDMPQLQFQQWRGLAQLFSICSPWLPHLPRPALLCSAAPWCA